MQQRCFDEIRTRQWKLVKATIASQEFQDEVIQKPLNIPGTLLHMACSIPLVPQDVISAILHAYPQSVSMEDEDGNLPIHLLCESAVRPDLVKMLLVADPDTSFYPSGELSVPFYILIHHCLQNFGLEAASDLISTLPPSLIYKEDCSVLHQVGSDLLPETLCLQLIEHFPQICKIFSHGNSLLHIICSHQESTPALVRKIIDISTESCAVRDSHGNLPIHLVNSKRYSDEIIHVLARCYPQGLRTQNAHGQIPLMSPLIRDSSIRVRAMLRCCSKDNTIRTTLLHSKNRSGMSPILDYFYVLQRQIADFVSQGVVSIEDLSSCGMVKKSYTNLITNNLESLAHIMRLAVYNDVEYTLDNPHKESFWTAFPIFTMVLLHHTPELACHQDCMGNFPLHIVARHTFEQLQIPLCVYCADEISGPYFWVERHTYCCTNCSHRNHFANQLSPLIEYQGNELIRNLLVANPSAAFYMDAEGNLPLHLSLKNGKTWCDGVDKLTEAAPFALAVMDKKTNLFPFMLAAEGKDCDNAFGNRRKLTTIYELLRAGPTQMIAA